MTLKQFRLLRTIHKLTPNISDEQNYPLKGIDDIIKNSKMSEEQILATALELEKNDYVDIHRSCSSGNTTITLVRITYSGVVAKNDYIPHKILSFLKNIIIPAFVSIICSLVVNYFQGNCS